MSQCDIVELREYSRIDGVQPADIGLLRTGYRSSGDKLMCHADVPAVRIDFHCPDSRGDGVILRVYFLFREEIPHRGLPYEREHVEVNLPVLVSEGDRLHISVIDRGEMDTAALHDSGAVGDALGTVVVSADDENLGLCLQHCKSRKEIIEKGNGGRRRIGPVEDIPGNDDRTGSAFPDFRNDLSEQDHPLFLNHRHAGYAPADMQIR